VWLGRGRLTGSGPILISDRSLCLASWNLNNGGGLHIDLDDPIFGSEIFSPFSYLEQSAPKPPIERFDDAGNHPTMPVPALDLT
jgi:hypothetical protein